MLSSPAMLAPALVFLIDLWAAAPIVMRVLTVHTSMRVCRPALLASILSPVRIRLSRLLRSCISYQNVRVGAWAFGVTGDFGQVWGWASWYGHDGGQMSDGSVFYLYICEMCIAYGFESAVRSYMI